MHVHHSEPTFPEFEPHPLIPGGHAQTLLGYYLPGKRFPYRAVRHVVVLKDGDAIVLHDDCPPNWNLGDSAALLMHGLSGCHRSGYMERTAGKLSDIGVRTFRMDLRGTGASAGLTRLAYHAGRTDDTLAALEEIGELCPRSPVCLVGFSISGNIALKLLGEAPGLLPENLTSAIAINPAIDPAVAVERLERPSGRLYDRHFARLLFRQLSASTRLLDQVPGSIRSTKPPRSMREFDALYTAPMSGFDSAEEYYRKTASAGLIPNIQIPTLILAARDDPVVPVQSFEKLPPSPNVRLHITDHGGHLGFLARGNSDPDRRWMEWRVVDWVSRAQDAVAETPAAVSEAG